MTIFDGAVRREALVMRVADELAPLGKDPLIRAAVSGAVRIGVIETVKEMAAIYPQLAQRFYAHFGMDGWEAQP